MPVIRGTPSGRNDGTQEYEQENMRKFFILAVALGLGSCGIRGPREGEKPVVLVSILPQKTFVEKIGGGDFTISVLIPHGANPTTYTLLPAQMAEISAARIWLRMGYVGFELSWGERIREANPRMEVTDLSEGLQLIGITPTQERGGISGIDPHTWMSPANVRIMAARILEELVKINPAKKEEYTARFEEFVKEIDATDAEIREILNDSRGKKVITYHPSLTYFARDYGLEQLSVEQGGKEATPAHLARLAEMAQTENIRVIYIQSEFDRELAAVFAAETGGSVIQIWPLNPDWSANLTGIARQISGN